MGSTEKSPDSHTVVRLFRFSFLKAWDRYPKLEKLSCNYCSSMRRTQLGKLRMRTTRETFLF